MRGVLVNQHQTEAIDVTVALPEANVRASGTVHRLHHDDPLAMNTPAQPDTVVPSSHALDGLDRSFTHELPPASYTILELSLR